MGCHWLSVQQQLPGYRQQTKSSGTSQPDTGWDRRRPTQTAVSDDVTRLRQIIL